MADDIDGTVDDLQTLISLGRTFGCVYLDPPWRYGNTATENAAERQYAATMTVDEIATLPVSELAAKDAHLHLWTTNAFLFECPRLFETWGFTFKASFVWIKNGMGMGNYWRNSHEFLLTAVRGDATRFSDHSLLSWGAFNRGAHSAKPEQLRTMIERASPGPYLELFGRRAADRWVVWGNEIDPGCLFTAAAKRVA